MKDRSLMMIPVICFTFACGTRVSSAFAAPAAICLSDDNQTCLVLSAAASEELTRGHNVYGDDIQVRLVRESNQETGRTLRSIKMVATRVTGGQTIPDFSFQNPVDLQWGHWCLFEKQIGSDRAPSSSSPYVNVSDVRELLGIFWSNGKDFLRLGGLRVNAQSTLILPIRNAGVYELHLTRTPVALRLAQGSPYPRIITPHGPYNRKSFLFVDYSGPDTILGSIYDFSGGLVRTLRVDANSPAPNALVWDARDESGALVPSGPYYYKVTAGNQSVTGGLVVAR